MIPCVIFCRKLTNQLAIMKRPRNPILCEEQISTNYDENSKSTCCAVNLIASDNRSPFNTTMEKRRRKNRSIHCFLHKFNSTSQSNTNLFTWTVFALVFFITAFLPVSYIFGGKTISNQYYAFRILFTKQNLLQK